VDADCGARRRGTYLDQVGELVDKPESSSAELASRRPAPPDEPVVQVSLVVHLDDERAVLLPEAQHALAAGVAHAVGCELVSGKRQIASAGFESRGDGVLGDEATHRTQVGAAELDDDSTHGRLGKGLIDERGDSAAFVAATDMALTGAIDEGMGAVGIVDHDPVERGAVVRTKQPEASSITEDIVEQLLASSALDKLRWTAIGPHRFADASYTCACWAVLVDEALQQRDHTGRVATDGRDVGELHVVGLVVDECSQCGGLGGVDGDEDRLARRESSVDEARCTREEVALVGIEEDLMAQSIVQHWVWTTRCEPPQSDTWDFRVLSALRRGRRIERVCRPASVEDVPGDVDEPEVVVASMAAQPAERLVQVDAEAF
jgi:hypothetical protein